MKPILFGFIFWTDKSAELQMEILEECKSFSQLMDKVKGEITMILLIILPER